MTVKQTNRIIFVLISITVLISMLSLEPKRRGDGNEYFLMLESLRNHLSPDLRQEDIDGFYDGELNAFGEKLSPHSGYFENKESTWYCYHFWAYSLASVPSRLILESLDLDTRKSLQLTNAILFISMLALIVFGSRFKEKQKMLLVLLLTFSPALWFIHWTHAETFIFSLVVASLVFLHRQSHVIAIILAAIASFQNQALVFFVLFLLITAVLSSRYKSRSLLKYGAISSLALFPSLFYLMKFGEFSLLSRAVSIRNISALRIYEMFFDLNIGMFPYIPISVLFFFGIVLFETYRRRAFTGELQIFSLLIAMMAVCSMNDNWNSDTSGPIRYAVWMLPFVFFVIAKNVDLIFDKRILKYTLIGGIVLQAVIVVGAGTFLPRISYRRHNVPARMILNRFPGLYSPSHEIFCERTLEGEGKCADPTVYMHDGECRKALVTCNGLRDLQSLCKGTDPSIEEDCGQREGWFYVDYR